MNKYLLIISAMAVFGGFSNMFSAEGKPSRGDGTVLGSAGKFCAAVVKEHPKKLGFCCINALAAKMNDRHDEGPFRRHSILLNKFEWPGKRVDRVYSPSLACVVLTYSIFKTIYDRSKQ